MPQALPPCPETPNCVSSQAAASDGQHFIPPFTWEGASAEQAMRALKAALGQFPRTKLVLEKPDYVKAECTTLILRFVDDVEFALDPQMKRIDVRSASRVGRSDFGANRKRVESLRTAFRAALKS